MDRRSLLPSLFGGGGLARRGETDPFMAFQREMNRLFDDAIRGFGAPALAGETGAVLLAPMLDVRERENALEVQAELPGVNQDDVDITLDEDLLTIRGEKKAERREEKENVWLMERSFGSFSRSVRLPFRPQPDQVQARFQDGVLTLTLPRPPEQQQRQHRIRIGGQGATQTGSQGGGQGQGRQMRGQGSERPEGEGTAGGERIQAENTSGAGVRGTASDITS